MAKSSSIVDRVEGWGHTDGTDTVRNDAGAETTTPDESVDGATEVANNAAGGRWDRQLVARKEALEAGNTAIADRTKGYQNNTDQTAGADNYGETMAAETAATLADPQDYKNGIFNDEAGADARTGSDIKITSNATETSKSARSAAGRTKDARDTVDLNDDDAASLAESARTSIRDRSDGWGHTEGSFTARKDS